MKVHVIDGTFELFRCFHGAPRATSTDGKEVGAVRGLVHTLVALLRKPDVSHVAIAFDQMAGRARGDGRDSADSLLRSQYMPAADAVRALGIVIWPMHRYQADDALATAAARYQAAPSVEQIVICTTDRDLMQCVRGDRVVVLDRIRKRVTDEKGVLERFGVRPRQIPELFALVGDPSDGLPGIPGWGAKSAAAVLQRYDCIEDIPGDVSVWDLRVRGAASLAKALASRRREAVLMRNLSILRTDLPLGDDVADLAWGGADREALSQLAVRIDVEDVLERVPLWSDRAPRG
jgi:5'-3' exonuclease